MDIKEVLSRPEYQFIQTNPHLGGSMLFATFGGSHAYGTNKPTSDIDIRGCLTMICCWLFRGLVRRWPLALCYLGGAYDLTQFPIDTWMKKLLNEVYSGTFDTTPYKGFEGFVQQLQFYYYRHLKGK